MNGKVCAHMRRRVVLRPVRLLNWNWSSRSAPGVWGRNEFLPRVSQEIKNKASAGSFAYFSLSSPCTKTSRPKACGSGGHLINSCVLCSNSVGTSFLASCQRHGRTYLDRRTSLRVGSFRRLHECATSGQPNDKTHISFSFFSFIDWWSWALTVKNARPTRAYVWYRNFFVLSTTYALSIVSTNININI